MQYRNLATALLLLALACTSTTKANAALITTFSAGQAQWTDRTFRGPEFSFPGYVTGYTVNPNIGNFALSVVRNAFTFLATDWAGQFVLSASLQIFNPVGGYVSSTPSLDYGLFDVAALYPTFPGFGPTSPTNAPSCFPRSIGLAPPWCTDIYNDLGSGTSWGQTTMTSANDGSFVSIALNQAAVASLNNPDVSGLWSIGGTMLGAPQLFDTVSTPTTLLFAQTGRSFLRSNVRLVLDVASQPPPPPTAVSEPESWLMFLAGLLALGALRIRTSGQASRRVAE